MAQRKKRVVLFGGGKGLSELVRGFMLYPRVAVTAVVSMADNGGSSGKLRKTYGVLPPGDMRRVLLAAATVMRDFAALWEHRFASGPLRGHVVGNLVLAAWQQRLGSEAAFAEANAMLATRARVLPVTTQATTLIAELTDGKKVFGETNINVPKEKRAAIKRVILSPIPKMTLAVRKAIQQADVVVLGPGDLYTSLLPVLLTYGMPSALSATRARVVYTCNLFTKYGETDGYTVADFYAALERCVGKNVVDAIVVNTGTPSSAQMRQEKGKRGSLVRYAPDMVPSHVRVSAGSFIGKRSLYENGRLYAKKIISLL